MRKDLNAKSSSVEKTYDFCRFSNDMFDKADRSKKFLAPAVAGQNGNVHLMALRHFFSVVKKAKNNQNKRQTNKF